MTTTQQTARPDYLGLLVAGYVMAFVLPIGGLIVGFALSERRLGHAMAIACLSTLVALGWAWLLLD